MILGLEGLIVENIKLRHGWKIYYEYIIKLVQLTFNSHDYSGRVYDECQMHHLLSRKLQKTY